VRGPKDDSPFTFRLSPKILKDVPIGATVYMLCRDPKRGQDALNQLKESTSNPNIHLEIIDVSRPSQLKSFADKIGPEFKVNILINNAGILPAERVETPDGIESTFATNALSTFYLTKLLIPNLEKAESPRVVTVLFFL
jgi:dehydrogenase/reductase SDR family member 12